MRAGGQRRTEGEVMGRWAVGRRYVGGVGVEFSVINSSAFKCDLEGLTECQMLIKFKWAVIEKSNDLATLTDTLSYHSALIK